MKQLKILYVDDDIINRKLLKNILKKNPMVYEMLEAKDGKETLEVLNKNPDVDLVLLDILMPEMDGIETLKHMKKDPRFSRIPVIALSTDETQKSRAIDAGANDFINKPIKEQDLNQRIEKFSDL